jgi:SAM-dependent MidA family methyltransferase
VPNQSQLDWIDDVAAQLDRGFVLAFDYGFVESEFHEVVQARSQHQLLDSPFDHLGQADVSVHINWTNVAHRAEQRGLRVAGFTDQHHFLTGIVSTWAEQPSNSRSSAKSNRELQTLLHPEMLGRAFQVLALAKNIDTSQPIAGFRFARDARAALELSS